MKNFGSFMKQFCFFLLGLCFAVGCVELNNTVTTGDDFHEFCIVTEMPLLGTDSPDLNTKASLQSKVSLKWENNDELSIVNLTTGKALGGNLHAVVNGDRVQFEGALAGEVKNGDQLIAIYPSQQYTEEQPFSYAEIDFSLQTCSTKDDVQFCAYTCFTCVNASMININTSFTIPVSYVQIALANLDESSKISFVEFTRVGSKITLSGDNSGIRCSSTMGNVVLKPENVNTNSNGNAFVYCAMASSSKGSVDRTISVLTGEHVFSGTWVKSDMAASKYYTTVSSTFTVNAAPSFEVFPPESLQVPAAGGDLSFVVSSLSDWEVVADEGLSVSPTNGYASNTEQEIIVSVPSNVSDNLRRFTITFSTIMESRSFEISQSRPSQNGDYIDNSGVNYGPGIDIDGVVWAPVYCGYMPATESNRGYEYGKLYQWGRKNGQGYGAPYSSSLSSFFWGEAFEDETSPVILSTWQGAIGEEDPAVFYERCSTPNGQWTGWSVVSDEHIWNLGTEAYPVKNSAHDPCPEGWRVPTWSEAQSLFENYVEDAVVDGKKGMWLSGEQPYNEKLEDKVFFAYTGARDWKGESSMRNGIFKIWTSLDHNSYYPYDYYFPMKNNSNAFAMMSDGRSDNLNKASACAVRCVRESSKAPNTLSIESPSSITLPPSAGSLEFQVTSGPYLREWTVETSDPSVMASVKNGGPGETKVVVVSYLENNSPSDTKFTVTFKWGNNNVGKYGSDIIFTDRYTFTQSGKLVELRDYVNNDGNNFGKGSKICGVIWAPVSVGCNTPFGPPARGYYYFQWGRNKGYYYEESVEEPMWLLDNESAAENVIYAGGSGSKFRSDWILEGDDSYWNLGSEAYPIKNAKYDPCPSGWRVPTKHELESLLSASLCHEDGYYVLSDPDNTNSSIRESLGYFWSSTPSGHDIYASGISLSNDGLKFRISTYPRSVTDMTVRCVQDK